MCPSWKHSSNIAQPTDSKTAPSSPICSALTSSAPNTIPANTELTPEVAYGWIDNETILSPNMLNKRANTIRQFWLYLCAVDEEAFVLTEKFCTNKSLNIPFNFTDSELAAISYWYASG